MVDQPFAYGMYVVCVGQLAAEDGFKLPVTLCCKFVYVCRRPLCQARIIIGQVSDEVVKYRVLSGHPVHEGCACICESLKLQVVSHRFRVDDLMSMVHATRMYMPLMNSRI